MMGEGAPWRNPIAQRRRPATLSMEEDVIAHRVSHHPFRDLCGECVVRAWPRLARHEPELGDGAVHEDEVEFRPCCAIQGR